MRGIGGFVLGAFLLTMLGCKPDYGKASVVYAVVGHRPLNDSIRLMSDSGKDLGAVTSIGSPYTISHLSSSTRSLLASVKVLDNRVLVDRLYLLSPPYEKWLLVDGPPKDKGTISGDLLPNQHQIIYTTETSNDPFSDWVLKLWDVGDRTTQVLAILRRPDVQGRFWFKVVSLSGDGRKAIIGRYRVRDGRLATTMSVIGLQPGGEITQLCNEDDGCVSAALSLDGESVALLCNSGLVIRSFNGVTDRLVLAADKLHGHTFMGEKLAWCDPKNTIYLPSINTLNRANEVLHISLVTGELQVTSLDNEGSTAFLNCF